MTGSDWRNYELMYSDETLMQRYENSEMGFIYLTRLLRLFINDFWLFAGILKAFYLYSIFFLFSSYIKKKWTAIGITFIFGTLFMLIDCPMRFMIGQAFLIFGYVFFINKKYVKSAIILLLSLFFHVTMIVPLFIILSSIFFNKTVSKANRFFLFLLYIIILILSTNESTYDYIYENIIQLFGLDDFATNITYMFYNTDSLYTIGTLKNISIFIFILYNRDIILKLNKGNYIYYFSCIYFFLTTLLQGIPTGFRLTLFLALFVVISIIWIFSHEGYKFVFSKKIVYILFAILLLKEVFSSPIYYPYSNSIPYIISGHLPYNYRSSYNYNQYFKLIGKDSL